MTAENVPYNDSEAVILVNWHLYHFETPSRSSGGREKRRSTQCLNHIVYGLKHVSSKKQVTVFIVAGATERKRGIIFMCRDRNEARTLYTTTVQITKEEDLSHWGNHRGTITESNSRLVLTVKVCHHKQFANHLPYNNKHKGSILTMLHYPVATKLYQISTENETPCLTPPAFCQCNTKFP